MAPIVWVAASREIRATSGGGPWLVLVIVLAILSVSAIVAAAMMTVPVVAMGVVVGRPVGIAHAYASYPYSRYSYVVGT